MDGPSGWWGGQRTRGLARRGRGIQLGRDLPPEVLSTTSARPESFRHAQPTFRIPARGPPFAAAAAALPGPADSKSFTKRKAFGTLASAKPANAKVLPLWRILTFPSQS